MFILLASQPSQQMKLNGAERNESHLRNRKYPAVSFSNGQVKFEAVLISILHWVASVWPFYCTNSKHTAFTMLTNSSCGVAFTVPFGDLEHFSVEQPMETPLPNTQPSLTTQTQLNLRRVKHSLMLLNSAVDTLECKKVFFWHFCDIPLNGYVWKTPHDI